MTDYTNAERQRRWREQQAVKHAEIARRAALYNAQEPRTVSEAKTPEEEAELKELFRRLREADELCKRGLGDEREALMECRNLVPELIKAMEQQAAQVAQMKECYDEDTKTIEELEARVEELETDEDAAVTP